jgi:hypothetical protein
MSPLFVIELVLEIVLIMSPSMRFYVARNIGKMTNNRVELIIERPWEPLEFVATVANNAKVGFGTEVKTGQLHAANGWIRGFRGADESKLDIDPMQRNG